MTYNQIINIIEEINKKTQKELNKDYIDTDYKDGYKDAYYDLKITIESSKKKLNYKQIIEIIKTTNYFK